MTEQSRWVRPGLKELAEKALLDHEAGLTESWSQKIDVDPAGSPAIPKGTADIALTQHDEVPTVHKEEV